MSFSRDKNRLKTFTAADLAIRTMPATRFIVPRFVPEGLTLLGGRPKVGKSWLLMNAALGVATGGVFLGEHVEGGDVLLLALEDNERRLQSRLSIMLAGQKASTRLHMTTACPTLDHGGKEAISAWCDGVENPRLIIVDVFTRIRPQAQSGTRLYEADYQAVLPLKALADDRGLGVIACVHTRKEAAVVDPFDSISATTGLAGAADSILILDRDHRGPKLYGRGRDLEEVEVALAFKGGTGTWDLLGDASEVGRSSERNTILAVLRAAGGALGPKEIAERGRLSHPSVKHLVGRMVKAGEILKVAAGTYIHPHHPVHHGHSDPSPIIEVQKVNGVNGRHSDKAVRDLSSDLPEGSGFHGQH